MDNVLLLRSPSGDGPDKYEYVFQDAGYHTVSVPVLETLVVNLDDLKHLVQTGPEEHGLSGVVVTSARSCEAWRRVVQELVPQFPVADWSTVPFYAVGQATAAALADITTVAGTSLLAPRNIRGGSETGTSEKLAHFILHDPKPPASSPALLYLTGDKNRDVLPSILQSGGIRLRSLQVYKTQGATSFPDDIQNAVHSVPERSRSWWIVYFAPSAADFVTPILREYFSVPVTESDNFSVKVAAIGSTTSAFLRNELQVRVDAVPPKPSPDALVASIRDFDASQPPT